MGLAATIRFLVTHPLNRSRRLRSVWRFAEWQVGARLVPGPVLVDFVGASKLIVARGSTGATGNLYTGLSEFEEMAFVGHVLRNGDLFVDIGANVGAYTILAAAWCEAAVISVEPSPATFSRLSQNVRLNDVTSRVDLHQVAVGEQTGEAVLTSGMDTMNHLLAPGAREEGIPVQMRTLDDIVGERTPFAMKIDVEGFEVSVLNGGKKVLAQPTLQALIVEMNGSGKLFGHEDEEVHKILVSHGFKPVGYDPFTRKISNGMVQRDNQIYVRDLEAVQQRINSARPISLPHDRAV